MCEQERAPPENELIQMDDYATLQNANGPCLIPDAADRGISCKQLLHVVDFLLQRCEKDGRLSCWTDAQKENLGSGEVLNIHSINLYQLNKWLLVPATRKLRCSFVEFISNVADSQIPKWFVSHWWGEPILLFASCMQHFIKMRGDESVFWICAYANNQHDLTAEVTDDPEQSSFRRALQKCKGTVMVLDEQATTFSRAWCTYETAITLRDQKFVDLVTFNRAGDPDLPLIDETGMRYGGTFAMISDGLLPSDESIVTKERQLGITPETKKAQRESAFPQALIKVGLAVSIETAGASVETDRVHILNSITGEALDAAPLVEHPAYTKLNSILRARFAMAWLYSPDVGKTRQEQKNKLDVILRTLSDAEPSKLSFDFPASKHLRDEKIVSIAQMLPPCLERLSLCVQKSWIGDKSIVALALRIPSLRSLTQLRIHFWGCENLGDVGLVALGKGLSEASGLEELRLDFSGCSLGDEGVKSIAENVALLTQLKVLSLNVSKNTGVSDSSLLCLRKSLKFLGGITELTLMFAGCSWITRQGVCAIGKGLCNLKAITKLSMNFFSCTMDVAALSDLTAGIGQQVCLTDLSLLFDESLDVTPKVQSKGKGKSRKKGTLESSVGKSLATHLPRFHELNHLTLYLCNLGGQDVEQISQAIRVLVNLRTLKLHFLDCVAGPGDVSHLCDTLSCLQHLSVMMLRLRGCGGVNDDSTVALRRFLAIGTKLSELTLDLSECSSLSRVGAESLASCIGKCGQLAGLELKLSRVSGFDDTTAVALAGSLGALLQLRRLCVVCKTCERLSERGVQALVDSMRRHSQLDRIHADFSNGKVGAQQLEEIMKGLKCSPACDIRAFNQNRIYRQKSNAVPEEREDELRQRLTSFATTEKNSLAFGAGELNSAERKIVHELAVGIGGLVTQSFGEGEQRYLVVSRDTTVLKNVAPNVALSRAKADSHR
eukprot:TRINITY_DN4067_c0_g1_i4.p1 TRINITY_DN4067_c0_g1~~TRINITY_DN4067_c0_g1_i4.p1  ORF type:complete len:948 (-),score=143.90 TRINITY_DN4067_c0_g1_i4:61-2904(-)